MCELGIPWTTWLPTTHSPNRRTFSLTSTINRRLRRWWRWCHLPPARLSSRRTTSIRRTWLSIKRCSLHTVFPNPPHTRFALYSSLASLKTSNPAKSTTCSANFPITSLRIFGAPPIRRRYNGFLNFLGYTNCFKLLLQRCFLCVDSLLLSLCSRVSSQQSWQSMLWMWGSCCNLTVFELYVQMYFSMLGIPDFD